MEILLDYLRAGFIQQGQAAAQNIAPLSAQLVMAILVLLVTQVLAGKARKSVGRAVAIARSDAHIAILVARSAHIAVWSLGILVILGIFGIGWTAIGAALGVVGLAITVSMQDVLKNLVAGIYLLLERPFRLGDVVKVKDFTGTVEDVGLRTTCLRTDTGSQVIIPNATIFVEVVVNSGATVPEETLEQR